ncbi:hypothetical protein ACIOHE_26495 [Streptomyces sp. NPDC087851]
MQERVQKPVHRADKRRTAREDEEAQERRPEVRRDVWDRWFKER